MENVVLVIHLILALLLIGAVLLQRSEGGALGMGGGGGGGGVMSGRSAATALQTPKDWATDTTGSFYNRPMVVAGWSAHDVANAAGRAFRLPPELFEKNVWAGDGTRTVFTDQDGNVVM